MDNLSTPLVTVLGVGNVILTDEGFGVRVVEYLDKNYTFDESVQLIDGGTLGIELTKFITGTEKLLIIDSVNSGGEKGKVFCFTGGDVLAHFEDKISAHEVGIKDVLALLKVTDKYPKEVVVIGAEPYDLNAGVGLSGDMQKLLPKVAEKAIEILKKWEVKVTKKSDVNIDFSTIAEDMGNKKAP
ncbi:MAG: HyaD/HybD family hydrogenase maturation endopeptidase [Selenomonadaceae bacterium]|nr:HyaD/HybD family hydrogenase maturation endopeptidase [Selenomonadaceae bacterium]